MSVSPRVAIPLVLLHLPLKQGLKQTSFRTFPETRVYVLLHLPLKQGLKLQDKQQREELVETSSFTSSIKTRIETGIDDFGGVSFHFVLLHLPLKQGLKLRI